MAFIIGLVVIGLFFLALHYFTEFNNSQKINITTIVLAILAIAVMFNEYSEQENKKMMDATIAFKQNKTLKCKGGDVNTTGFTLSIGTHTFIGKEDTVNSSVMISASDCE